MMNFDKVFVLTDENTNKYCLPVIKDVESVKDATVIVIPSGDDNKNLDSLSHVWQQLTKGGATRHSLLVNIGGGVVTDLGGFAAGTFKRGIRYINIPTTLLSMVDASVGGKTGINFEGLKNEIGVFCDPMRVILDTQFLKTLDTDNFLSGYAEMLKHGLLSKSDMLEELLAYDMDKMDLQLLDKMIKRSIGVKKSFVQRDPHEKNIRKALNLGHTVGHAFESFAMEKKSPVLHGYAVAWGIICELYLSVAYFNFPSELMHRVVKFITEHYGKMNISCDDYERLFEYMTHDKKNMGDKIQFTLLSNIGSVRINRTITKEQIFESLDFYRDGQ
ncbi:MAG: 3-dehydroquinate synthase [Bacteroidaceae bacterium]|nr:3-dehydroquinate synthase [Bacteroidaceae bacterium]MCR4770585.1 3-dehydroquinate synthase [Bacteroidaceae bacterium]